MNLPALWPYKAAMSEQEPRYPFVRVDVPEEVADEASGLLFELGALGVEQRDATTLSKGAEGSVTLVASFPDHEAAREAIESLDEAWKPALEEVVGDAWRDAWKEHYRPFSLTPRVTVRPPWEEHEAAAGQRVLVLEPGRAFGTGLHATTSLVARTLDRESSRFSGQVVLDVGTGSGILALTALVLGASRVVATDNDPDAIAVTLENAARNGFSAQIDASTRELSQIDGRFPVVVANIEARVLIPLAGALRDKVAPGGMLVLSGILAGQEGDVAAAYPGLTLSSTEREGDWVCLALLAPPA